MNDSPLLVFNTAIPLEFTTVLGHERGNSTHQTETEPVSLPHQGNQDQEQQEAKD